MNAIILSYLVYQDDAKIYLKKLSKNSNRYYESHKEILNEYLKVCNKKLQISRVVKFGH